MANQAPNKKVKNKKPSRSIFKEMGSELKKVSFPSLSTTLKQTSVVISLVLFFTLVILGVDSFLGFLYTKLLGL